jgi:hypothetical protein
MAGGGQEGFRRWLERFKKSSPPKKGNSTSGKSRAERWYSFTEKTGVTKPVLAQGVMATCLTAAVGHAMLTLLP